MYTIKPQSAKTFIDDPTIRLPRFQRKQTWGFEKNFKLCVSIFRGYPLGVLVLSQQENGRGKTLRWLLDGRQRRDALTRIQENPEFVYNWARKYLGLKKSFVSDEIANLYWEKINEYLEQDTLENTEDNKQESTGEKVAEEAELPESEEVPESPTSAAASSQGNLDLLLKIILVCHSVTPTASGFTRPFDLKPLIEDLPFVENNSEGKRSLNGRKLRSFIVQFRTYCSDNKIEEISWEVFADYVIKTFKPEGAKHTKIKALIQQRWSQLQERINLVEEIEARIRRTDIGVIEIENISPADEQKIFNIINTGGTQLTAVEVLSAKNFWNTPLKNPSASLSEKAKAVYDFIEMKPEGIVRWDLPATLISRLTNGSLAFNIGFTDNASFERSLTLGFKLLSAIYQNGIKKESIDLLSRNTKINWELDIDALIQDLDNMLKVLGQSLYFQFLRTWRVSVFNLLGDAIALNFVAALYSDWKRKSAPIGGGVKTIQFQKNGFILLDRFIYEYTKRQWRGSSDSRVAQNLSAFATQPEILQPIEKDKWASLLKDAIEKNQIDDAIVGYKTFEAFLYHFYCLMEIGGPDLPSDTVEIDHLIPQSLFKGAVQKASIKSEDNLCNLSLLPSRENASKNDKKLNELPDGWIRLQIKKYAFIDEADFGRYSKVESLGDLVSFRRSFFERDFLAKRAKYLA